MSLDENIVSVVQAIGTEIKDVRADMALISGGGGGTQNVFIQSTEPAVLQGQKALWIQTTADGSVMFNLVTGD
jgi:hypothetical protein